MRTFAVISLGCDKNRVDSERILGALNGAFALSDVADAQLIVVNTCAFIEAAREEAVDAILAAAEYKKDTCEKLMVTGCLAELYADDIRSGLPEVDAIVPASEYRKIAEIATALFDEPPAGCAFGTRLLTTPPHYAYLKIADGCDNKCTYCMIPALRGPYVSTPMDELVAEAEGLVKDGVKELILVAQDLTRYGKDLYGEYKLTELLRRLCRTDVQKLRLMYCYPEMITDELIEMIAREDKIAKYIDIPLQHFDDGVLKRMNRKSTGASIVRLMDKIRAADANIAIRTTVMVGFPGETEAAFDALYRFLETYRLEHVGVFAYSDEETPSSRLPDKVPEDVKLARADKIGRLHYENTVHRNERLIGQVVRVLYEDVDYDRQLFKGRTEQNAPEVDTCVYFTADFADAGQVYDVRITAVDGYDVIGERI